MKLSKVYESAIVYALSLIFVGALGYLGIKFYQRVTEKRTTFAEQLRRLEPLAKQGDVIAQYELGRLYSSDKAIPTDYEKAFQWAKMAAEQDYPKAQWLLGALYGDGLGVERNFDEMMKWFRKAAQAGVPEAQFALAKNLLTNVQNYNNDREAFEWYEVAAMQGHAAAQFQLGAYMYREGRGTRRDLVQAYKWISLAIRSKKGWQIAENTLRDIRKEMTPGQIIRAEEQRKTWERILFPDEDDNPK